MGSDRQRRSGNALQGISIHAPAWGATGLRRFHRHVVPEFQSTLPHGERRLLRFHAHGEVFISIHAPAWGATTEPTQKGGASGIFQSTLPHGERLGLVEPFVGVTYFNPRSRMGSDTVFHRRAPLTLGISIHAPAWGATLHDIAAILIHSISIHAPAWGATGPASRFRRSI